MNDYYTEYERESRPDPVDLNNPYVADTIALARYIHNPEYQRMAYGMRTGWHAENIKSAYKNRVERNKDNIEATMHDATIKGFMDSDEGKQYLDLVLDYKDADYKDNAKKQDFLDKKQALLDKVWEKSETKLNNSPNSFVNSIATERFGKTKEEFGDYLDYQIGVAMQNAGNKTATNTQSLFGNWVEQRLSNKAARVISSLDEDRLQGKATLNKRNVYNVHTLADTNRESLVEVDNAYNVLKDGSAPTSASFFKGITERFSSLLTKEEKAALRRLQDSEESANAEVSPNTLSSDKVVSDQNKTLNKNTQSPNSTSNNVTSDNNTSEQTKLFTPKSGVSVLPASITDSLGLNPDTLKGAWEFIKYSLSGVISNHKVDSNSLNESYATFIPSKAKFKACANNYGPNACLATILGVLDPPGLVEKGVVPAEGNNPFVVEYAKNNSLKDARMKLLDVLDDRYGLQDENVNFFKDNFKKDEQGFNAFLKAFTLDNTTPLASKFKPGSSTVSTSETKPNIKAKAVIGSNPGEVKTLLDALSRVKTVLGEQNSTFEKGQSDIATNMEKQGFGANQGQYLTEQVSKYMVDHESSTPGLKSVKDRFNAILNEKVGAMAKQLELSGQSEVLDKYHKLQEYAADSQQILLTVLKANNKELNEYNKAKEFIAAYNSNTKDLTTAQQQQFKTYSALVQKVDDEVILAQKENRKAAETVYGYTSGPNVSFAESAKLAGVPVSEVEPLKQFVHSAIVPPNQATFAKELDHVTPQSMASSHNFDSAVITTLANKDFARDSSQVNATIDTFFKSKDAKSKDAIIKNLIKDGKSQTAEFLVRVNQVMVSSPSNHLLVSATANQIHGNKQFCFTGDCPEGTFDITNRNVLSKTGAYLYAKAAQLSAAAAINAHNTSPIFSSVKVMDLRQQFEGASLYLQNQASDLNAEEHKRVDQLSRMSY